jgi:hypothetical protein
MADDYSMTLVNEALLRKQSREPANTTLMTP